MPTGRRLNCQDIESERSVSRTVFAKGLPCDSREMPLFLAGDRLFGRAKLASRRRPRLDFDKRHGRAIISYEVDFALHSAKGEVAIITHPGRRRYQYAYVSPRTPVRRGLIFATSLEVGSVKSDRPFRGAQSTKPNITREDIGTASSCLATYRRTSRQAASLSVLPCTLCIEIFAQTGQGTQGTEKT
jgi:hypothetical protein